MKLLKMTMTFNTRNIYLSLKTSSKLKQCFFVKNVNFKVYFVSTVTVSFQNQPKPVFLVFISVLLHQLDIKVCYNGYSVKKLLPRRIKKTIA